MATVLHDLSIAELSSLIAARTPSPVELVEALIQRVEQYDGHEPGNIFSFPASRLGDAPSG